MSYRMSDMKWKNIRANRCPKCGSKLTSKASGLECEFVDPYYQTPCGFFISKEKADALKEKLRTA